MFLLWDAKVKNKPSESAALSMPERRVREFLAAENPSANNLFEDSVWTSERIGKSSWNVSHGSGGHPMIWSSFLVDRKGTVHRFAAGPLSDIMREEFRPHVTDPDHEKFIADFLKMLSGHFIRLQSVDDIPGYQNGPLPAEQAAEIQPPHRTPEGTQVFFTYQQIGGFVRRYEVHYAKDGGFLRVEETVLGRGIGDARYYI